MASLTKFCCDKLVDTNPYHANSLKGFVKFGNDLKRQRGVSMSFRYVLKIGIVIIVDNKVKERISKRVFQESKARQNFRKANISHPLFGNFVVLCFLKTPVLRFALLPYY